MAEERLAFLALREASGTVIDAISASETVALVESFSSTVRVFLSQPSVV